MKQASLKTSNRKCNQCGSPLLIAGKKIEKIDNYSPITVTIYKCSNKECQADIDKKTKARVNEAMAQKLAKESRIKPKVQQKIKIHKKKILR